MQNVLRPFIFRGATWPARSGARSLVVLAAWLATGALFAADKPHDSTGAKASTETKGYRNIGVEEFDKLRAVKQNRVLDVRTAKEFATGHMPDATNIDINSADFQQKVSALDKTKTYLVHCAGGIRSARACSQMSGLSFSNLYNLEGGFRAWEKAGKPVQK